MFKDEIKIPEMIELMMKYKNSSSKNENEIFACMIYNLFEEYRYLQQYPRKELLLTSQLYGAIINSRLVDGGSLEVAQTCVLTALKKQGAMFEFGIKAVESFRSRIHEWPNIVLQLFENENIRNQHPELLYDIK